MKAVRLSIDRDTGNMKGFGHADFDTPDQAAWAVEKLQGVEVRNIVSLALLTHIVFRTTLSYALL